MDVQRGSCPVCFLFITFIISGYLTDTLNLDTSGYKKVNTAYAWHVIFCISLNIFGSNIMSNYCIVIISPNSTWIHPHIFHACTPSMPCRCLALTMLTFNPLVPFLVFFLRFIRNWLCLIYLNSIFMHLIRPCDFRMPISSTTDVGQRLSHAMGCCRVKAHFMS